MGIVMEIAVVEGVADIEGFVGGFEPVHPPRKATAAAMRRMNLLGCFNL